MKRQGGFRNLFSSMLSHIRSSKSNESDTVNKAASNNIQQWVAAFVVLVILCCSREFDGLQGVFDGNFWPPPTESTPLNPSRKNLSQVITAVTPTSVPNLVRIPPQRALGKWVKYNKNYFYFLVDTYRGQTPWPILMGDGSNVVDLCKGVPCWGFIDIAVLLGVISPQKTQILGTWIGVFKSYAHNIASCMLSKLLHQLQPHYALWQRPPSTLRWVVQLCAQQIQRGDGRLIDNR